MLLSCTIESCGYRSTCVQQWTYLFSSNVWKLDFFFCPRQYAGMCDHAVVVGGRSLAGEQMASSPNWAAELAYRSAAELPVGAWTATVVSIHPKNAIAKHPCIAQ